MNKHQDLESRLRSYLSAGARQQPPSGMEDRIATSVFRRGHGLALQLLAAAAVLVVAIGLGIGLNKARQLAGGVTPTASPLASATAGVKPSPTVGPTPSLSPGLYPLMVPASMHMTSASVGWAAGSTTDRILRTTDGGAHWEDVTPRRVRPSTWTTFFLDADHAWLASSLQPGSPTGDFTVEVYRTADGGRSWQQVATITPGWGFPATIDFIDSKHGWILMKQDGTVDPSGFSTVALYGTVDGGATWEMLSQADSTGLAGHLPLACSKADLVFVSASTGWIPGGCGVGGGYFFYVTRDGGRNWAAVSWRMPPLGTASCDCSIESLRFSDNQHGVLVLVDAYQDARGYAQNFLYTTSDGGRSWQLGPMMPINAYSVYFLDAAHGWAFDAKASSLLYTSDAGQHWTTLGPVPSPQGPVDFQFVTITTGWVIGAEPQGRIILKTADGGETWTTQLAP